ncbi:MAG: ABC transporter ATP-binding protein [Chloroflexota bacterium]|nr:ABC transporter ATP-binding protein [Chloroflexota bacterium]
MRIFHAQPQANQTLGVGAPAVQFISLTKRYSSSALALDSLSLEVARGEVMGFLGPNGAGKTTTIRLVLDLIRPTAGRVLVFGLDCNRSPVAAHHRMGYLPADLRLYDSMRVDRLLRLFGGLRPGSADWSYMHSLCSSLEVPLERRVGDLSRGNKQKVGIVLAFMHRPDLLVLDEPTTGLDPLVQHQVLEMIRGVRAEGRTVFFSSHVLPEVEQICDRVAIIREGRLAAVEDVHALRGRRVHQFRLTFGGPVAKEEFAKLAGVRVLHHQDHVLHLEITGDADPLVKAAARYHVVALETMQPSLEEVFMAYYGPRDAGAGMKGEARA